MRVVLDTNVIIAAFASRGLCSEVFELCLADHAIVISSHILTEVEEKLIGKIRLPKETVRHIIDYLKDEAEIVEPALLKEAVCRDKTDDKIIGTALSGNAALIITGDEDLLTLKSHEGIGIITPREFWNFLKQEPR